MERKRDWIFVLDSRQSVSSEFNKWNIPHELRKEHTCLLNLFTKASNPSRETFAGILTGGASDVPSSSERNWTTILGVGAGGSGSGSGTP